MKKSKTVKTLTLFSFIILLTSFIAFKAGTFDKYFKHESERPQTLNSEQAINSGVIPVDTPTVKKVDTIKVNPTMMSTSKSLILLDQKIKFPIKDSLKNDSTKRTPKK